MSVIEAVRAFVATYPHLKAGAPLLVDRLGADIVEYAIIPQPGAKIVESYINGASVREFPFSLQSMESTADDLERIENSGFFEGFSDWLESQSETGNLPTLGAKKTATAIEALGWGFLYEQGASETGIYQIQCKLTFEQVP